MVPTKTDETEDLQKRKDFVAAIEQLESESGDEQE